MPNGYSEKTAAHRDLVELCLRELGVFIGPVHAGALIAILRQHKTTQDKNNIRLPAGIHTICQTVPSCDTLENSMGYTSSTVSFSRRRQATLDQAIFQADSFHHTCACNNMHAQRKC